jgi:hypothetical protein
VRVAQQVERIDLLARYTTFVGARTYYTKAQDIRRFASARLVAWAGAGNGTDPEISIQVQQSGDLSAWDDVGTAFEPDGDEVPGERDFTQPWLRLKVTLSGTSPAFTCWMTGEFVVRGR